MLHGPVWNGVAKQVKRSKVRQRLARWSEVKSGRSGGAEIGVVWCSEVDSSKAAQV